MGYYIVTAPVYVRMYVYVHTCGACVRTYVHQCNTTILTHVRTYNRNSLRPALLGVIAA